MTIFVVMVPTIILAATEDMLREITNKVNKAIAIFNKNRAVRMRRSRSQHRWA